MRKTVLKFGALVVLLAAFAIGVQYAVSDGPAVGASVGFGALALFAIPLAPGLRSNAYAFDRGAYLKTLKLKAKLMQPATAARLEGVLTEVEESMKPENIEATAEAMRDLMERIKNKDADAKAEFAKMRVVSVDNFVIATTNPVSFFDTVSLEDDEIPYIENTSRQEIVVSYIGQDGRARKTQPIRYQRYAQVDLHELSTEEYEYQLRDIYKGEIKTAQLANVDLARDFEMQLNKLMWPFIKSAIGDFVTTGPRAGRTFVPHSIVNVKNLPTTNLLEPDGNTNDSLWRKECMDVILRYAASWGNSLDNAFGGQVGQMKPTAVYIPSSEVMGFLDQVQLTSFGNSVVEEVFETGFVLNYGGARWVFIADATLDPDEGLAYVKFNKAIGTFFTKPGMDETFEDESIQMRKQNKGSVSMLKVVGWGLPLNWRLNVAAVRYHNAR